MKKEVDALYVNHEKMGKNAVFLVISDIMKFYNAAIKNFIEIY